MLSSFLTASLLLTVSQTSTATPAPALSLPRNDSCLTPAQQKQLKEAVTTIHDVLATATASLEIAYALEKDPTTKANLKIAITVISAVNQDLVANLTKIANEACGTCTQIVQVVNDSINSIKQTLEKIDPDWQNNPIWKAVFTAITAILQIVKALCPDAAVRALAPMKPQLAL